MRNEAVINFSNSGDEKSQYYKIIEVIHVPTDYNLDFAICKISPFNDTTAVAEQTLQPIPMSMETATTIGQEIAAIGFPAKTKSESSEAAAVMKKIFGNKFSVKRFSTGKILSIDTCKIQHDCTTLPGSSGSVIIDVKTCTAIALHYSGEYMAENNALPIAPIVEELNKIKNKQN